MSKSKTGAVTQPLILSQSDVAELIDPHQLLDALAQGFCDLALGKFQTPDRPQITVPNQGFMLSMPAWRPGSPIVVKMVSVFEKNVQNNLPNHLAVINLFSPDTGMLDCVMDGTFITGIRTAGAAMVSVRALARPDARVATIVGAGVQAREHLKLLPLVRNLDEILVYSLKDADAIAVARLNPLARAVTDLQEATRRSDIVCLATHAYEAVIDADWVQPGTHVTSVGYAPPNGELPPELARRNTLYVEDSVAFAKPPAGCGELRDIDPAGGFNLGEVLMGSSPKRTSEKEITVYKAMGLAMEDAVAAELAYVTALKTDTYSRIAL